MLIFNHVISNVNVSLERVEENGQRYYKTPDGVFPSVTTVTGWEKKNFFSKWRKDNPEEAIRVCSRGNKLHSIIENYLNNNEGVKENSNEVDLFRSMKPHIDKINNIRALESPLYSKILGLAGRVDCIAEYNKQLCVIDFKGSTRIKNKDDIENYFLQAAAYALMWQERTGEKCKKICIIIGTEKGITQVFVENTIDYVKKLQKVITTYRKYNEPLQTR
jgi:genome maintenance exonuclease 1